MLKISDMFEKQSEKRSALWIFCVGVVIVLALTYSGVAQAAVRDNKIENVPGLRFENVVYDWDKIILDVVNTTVHNRIFEGIMIFLDRRGKPVASAALLPKKLIGLKSERCAAHILEGSGESARRAVRVIWDFGTR